MLECWLELKHPLVNWWVDLQHELLIQYLANFHQLLVMSLSNPYLTGDQFISYHHQNQGD